MAEVLFGEWLKRRRSSLGLTQEQLALQINCSTSALRKFESEERRPSADVLERLAKIFNISQEERKSFLRFARGDWKSSPIIESEDAPWRVSYVAPRSNLPASTTSFIGREKEQNEIKNLIAKNRLVTLIGAGGIGKTRLSIQTAFTLLSDFPNGIWLVELAPLSDPVLVPQAIVNTLGLIEQADRPPLTLLSDFLHDKHILLILDNCEHLIQACAQLAEALLQACPDLHILATSREALEISGETLYQVPSLKTPDLLNITFDILPQYEAVQLFVERAQSARRDFSLTQENAHAIAQVCQHLDGIPLALELAAARVRVLRAEEIAMRLDDRFHLLTGGARTALPRHQTLRATIDWSHDLLSELERVLLRRLAIFAGGWTLEAAESTCEGDGIEKHDILDLLTQLVNKSLVLTERQQGQETRYHLLETIRQYAHEKLWREGEGELMRGRHLAYYVELTERAEPNLRSFGMMEWLDRLETELDNIRIALEWAQETAIEAQLRLASALLWFWHIRTHKNEGIDWLERGLSIEAAERGDQPLTLGRALIRGKALNTSGFLIAMGVGLQRAEPRFEESLSLFQQLGPAGKQGTAYALMRLGSVRWTDEGKKLLEQSLRSFREMGDKFGAAESLMLLSGGVRDDDHKQAVIRAEEHLALSKEIGDQDGIANGLGNLGYLAFLQGDYQRAITLLEECLARFRKLGNKGAIGFWFRGLGDLYFWQGDHERVTKIYQEGLAFAREIGDRLTLARNMYGLGVMAQLQGDYVRATQMIIDSLMVFREEGNIWLIAGSLHTLGDITLAQGDDKSAAQWYEAELAYSQEKQFRPGLIFASIGQGKVAWINGDYDQAIELFEDVMKKYEEAKERPAIFHAFYWLGQIAQSQSNYANAYANYIEMLKLQHQRIKVLFNSISLKAYFCSIAYPLGALGTLATLQDKMERGARLLSAAEVQYPAIRFEMSAKERAEHDQAIAAARAALGEEAFTLAWEEGKKMALDKAVEYALGDTGANVG